MKDEHLYEHGRVVWHSSGEDEGPDCGISLGLGDCMLYCGEISKQLHGETPGAAELGDDFGSWIIIYPKQGDATVIGKCIDRFVAQELIDGLAARFANTPPTTPDAVEKE